MKEDFLLHGTAADDTVRCMAAITTNLVAEARSRHQTAPTATAALGRTLTGTLLLGSTLKELDRLTIQIRSDGPIQNITAEANGKGQVRGYVGNPQADVPLKSDGKLDVGAVVGAGMFNVMRESGFDIGLRPEPYRGSVPLVSGEIAEDFAYYLTASEQLPSAVLLGVLLTPDADKTAYQVHAAGGVIVQMMPGADPQTITQIENNIRALPHTTTLIRNGATAEDLIKAVLGPLDWKPMGQQAVSFQCTCSYERTVSVISALPRAEVRAMLEEDGQAVLTCHFCNTDYLLDRAMLEQILAADFDSSN